MPALIPDPENFVVPMSNNYKGRINRQVKYPSGSIQPLDYFANLKKGYYLRRGYGNDEIINTFGCGECRWINTEFCPHSKVNGGDVSHLKHHSNGICSNRLHIPIKLHDEGYKMTSFQMLQTRAYMDAKYFADYKLKQALDGKCDMNDVAIWEKIAADILKDMRKQDEGSKLTVKKSAPDPVEFGELLRKSREVDVEIKDVEDNVGGVVVDGRKD